MLRKRKTEFETIERNVPISLIDDIADYMEEWENTLWDKPVLTLGKGIDLYHQWTALDPADEDLNILEAEIDRMHEETSHEWREIFIFNEVENPPRRRSDIKKPEEFPERWRNWSDFLNQITIMLNVYGTNVEVCIQTFQSLSLSMCCSLLASLSRSLSKEIKSISCPSFSIYGQKTMVTAQIMGDCKESEISKKPASGLENRFNS